MSAYGYLIGSEHKLWATYAMDKPNYGHVTSYIAESINSVLKSDRVLTVYGMFSEYYKRLASQFEDRMGYIAGYNDNYVLPKTLEKYMGQLGEAKLWMDASHMYQTATAAAMNLRVERSFTRVVVK